MILEPDPFRPASGDRAIGRRGPAPRVFFYGWPDGLRARLRPGAADLRAAEAGPRPAGPIAPTARRSDAPSLIGETSP